MGWLSEMLHRIKQGANGVGVGHLARHLLLPLAKELCRALLGIVFSCHQVPNPCQKLRNNARSSQGKKKA
ncbi:MAG: hypothetical protein SFW64_01655 [Alphaproteobacteria bacterium]|nr:hypothetical protein [Alphaproteobacteria bacterium]